MSGELELTRCMSSNRSGERCKNEPVPGSKYCLAHKAMERIAPQRNGRYSAALGRFREAYESSRSDPGLTDLREPLAATDVLIQHMLARFAEMDTTDFRKKARDLMHAHLASQFMREKLVDGQTSPVPKTLIALQEHLRTGCEEDRLMQRLVDTLQNFGRRIEGYHELKLARRNVVNAKDLVGFLARFLDVVRTEVTSDVYARIVERCDIEIMGGSASRALLAERRGTRTVVAEVVETKEPKSGEAT